MCRLGIETVWVRSLRFRMRADKISQILLGPGLKFVCVGWVWAKNFNLHRILKAIALYRHLYKNIMISNATYLSFVL